MWKTVLKVYIPSKKPVHNLVDKVKIYPHHIKQFGDKTLSTVLYTCFTQIPVDIKCIASVRRIWNLFAQTIIFTNTDFKILPFLLKYTIFFHQ